MPVHQEGNQVLSTGSVKDPQANTESLHKSEQHPRAELSLPALLESLLFVADGPVPASRIAAVLDITPEAVMVLLKELAESYAGRGLRLQWSSKNSVQLTTAPTAAAAIERFLGLETSTRLTPAALEALAIIAYQQPVTRPQVDGIRGVNSDGVIRTLAAKGLIEEVGRKESPGRPILYGTTPAFLGHFGLTSLEELPELEEEGEADQGEEEST
jgi:segregation and condensation protein B